jgi:hypothetical protein
MARWRSIYRGVRKFAVWVCICGVLLCLLNAVLVLNLPTGRDADNAGKLGTELRAAFSDPAHPEREPEIYFRPRPGAVQIVIKDGTIDQEKVLRKANSLKGKFGIENVSLSND